MMTNGDFSMYAMRLASRSASWAGDCMTLPDYRDKPLRQEAADRFLKSQRDLLDYIEQETREQPLSNPNAEASGLPDDR